MNAVLPKHVSISQDVLYQDLEQETILLNLADEQYFGLDDVAARMWQLLQESGDVEQTVSQLLSEFDVDETRLRSDLSTFIDQLFKAKLLTVS